MVGFCWRMSATECTGNENRKRRGHWRVCSRGLTPVEAALAVGLAGILATIAVPIVLRECHASAFVEATDGLAKLASRAVAYAQSPSLAASRQGKSGAPFPASAPLTPAAVPRGVRVEDPPGLWDTEEWRALDFRPVPDGAPHAFSFRFDSQSEPFGAGFSAKAHGDLDGDGVLSTFEVKGTWSPGDGARLEPGMAVREELE